MSRFLRSRRLAVWLLLLFALWSVIGTTIPQGDPGASEKLTRLLTSNPSAGALVMATGLNHAFRSPVFFIIGAWLAISTAMCAWERTRWALRNVRAATGVSAATIARLERAEPVTTIPGSLTDVRAAVTEALLAEGLKTRATPRVIEGRSWRIGLLGSPLFHWSLALLFVAIAAGQLTRSEGLIGVPVGGSVPNLPAEYGVYSAGVLRGVRNQELDVRVEALKLENVIDGIDRGPTPTVQLLRAGQLVAEGDVYPNSPLRYGSMLVHYTDRGYVGVFLIEDAEGSVVAERRAYFDFAEEAELGLGAGKLDLADIGIPEPIEVTPAERTSPSDAPRVSIALPDESGVLTPTELAVGAAVPVGAGVLRLESVGEYARLSVVDDWSVYVIYALFGLATIGIALAVLMPSKTAWVLLEEGDGGVDLSLVTRHQNGDPAFDESLVNVLKALEASNLESEADV